VQGVKNLVIWLADEIIAKIRQFSPLSTFSTASKISGIIVTASG
jgi:hypothetical protein